MGLFRKENDEFDRQLGHQREAMETGVAQQLMDPSSVGFDPQVSAMILRSGDFFLTYKPTKEGRLLLESKYEGFVEPGGIEPFAFLSDKKGDGEFLNEFDNVLMSVLDYGDKYGIDSNVRNSFNKLGRKRLRYINNSRSLEGKPQQLAKSQIIKSTGQILRGDGVAKKEKFLGLF